MFYLSIFRKSETQGCMITNFIKISHWLVKEKHQSRIRKSDGWVIQAWFDKILSRGFIYVFSFAFYNISQSSSANSIVCFHEVSKQVWIFDNVIIGGSIGGDRWPVSQSIYWWYATESSERNYLVKFELSFYKQLFPRSRLNFKAQDK